MNYRGDHAKLAGNGGSAAERVNDFTCGTHGLTLAYSASEVNSPVATFYMECRGESGQSAFMLSSAELLQLLEERKIKRRDIAEALGIDPAGVTRLFDGRRQLSLDEAKKLVEGFSLTEPEDRTLNIPVARLVVLYLADSVGARLAPEDPRVEELARDIRAFSSFAADPRRRESPELAEGFFQGLRLAPGRTTEA